MKISGMLQGLNPLKVAGATPKKYEKAPAEAFVPSKNTPLADIKEIYRKHNQPLDDKQLKEIDQFFSETEGSKTDKLKAIDMALTKGVPIESSNLEEIHAAIKTDGESRLLDIEVQDVTDQETLKDFVDTLELPESVKDYIIEQLDQGVPLKEILQNVVKQFFTVEVKEAESPMALLEQIKVALESLSPKEMALVLKAIAMTANTEMTSKVVSPQIEEMHSEDLVLSLALNEETDENKKAAEYVLKEKDSSATTNTKQMPSKLETSDPKHVSELTDEALDTEIEHAVDRVLEHLEVLASLVENRGTFKVFLVKETTEATIEAKVTFETFQKQLDTLLEVKPVAQMKENLEKAIASLDKLLIKSTVSLFSDMHMERDLLKASAELEQAKLAFKNEDFATAKAIMTSVKEKVGGIVFNPSITRIEAFATSKMDRVAQALEPRPVELDKMIAKQLSLSQSEGQTKSSKDVFETLRLMGLTHEVELADTIEGKSISKNASLFQANVKEILLKLMKEEVDARAIEKAENHLMNLAGQQSMTQQDAQDKHAFKFFNYPIEKADGALGDMKVYLNGPKSGEKLDSQNASLYFAVQIKGHGDVGVKLKIHSGRLDMTVQAERAKALSEYFEPMFEAIESMGYEKGQLSFEDSREVERNEKVTTSSLVDQGPSDEKGFDFKI